ncbi:hypothetical protein FIA58_003440 [Flavobacterium jejuense]|uniref:YcxB-like protein domain-containing protein n=1 Tax=Flavobacterium jejuense TaxID=1544455 RepID=A0ABX0ISA8_9FLAO|nr:hypothetical protein [Flavobacterium jejuense]NHN24720.1 hypothetical protein [Flavobacterium jejuense]
METYKKYNIKSKIILNDLIKLKSKGIFIVLLLFPLALFLNTIYTAFNNNNEFLDLATTSFSLLIIILLLVIPFVKVSLASDYQKNIYTIYTLKNKILFKKKVVPNNYKKFIIIKENFTKQNTNINLQNAVAEFKYPVYKFVVLKDNYKKEITSVNNESLKKKLQIYLEKESNLKLTKT